MNDSTIRTGGFAAGSVSNSANGSWSRLRLSSLVPILLAAGVLLPATSFPLEAKEFSMQDDNGLYQPYTPGMKLPDGVFAPMPGYTHEDLIEAAAKPVEALLKTDGVDPTLTRETLFALARHFNQALEEKLVEYRLAKLYQETNHDPEERARFFSQVAESCGAIAMKATTQSFRGSPLLDKSNEYLNRLSRSAGDGVYDLVITLSK